GAVLTFGTSGLDDRTAELVGGLASLLAVVLVTGMIFWMRSVGRRFAGELTGKLDRALDAGPFAIAAVAFLGVGREGLESALFFYATVESAGETGIAPALGWVVGIGAAVALGIAIYLGAVRIDLAQFFRWTGVGLVIVAAGILAYAVHELQEAGVLPGENVYAFDLRSTIDPTSPLAMVVRGILNLRPRMAVLEIGAWAAYLVVVLPLFLRGVGRRPTATAAAAAESVPAAKR
ncbi:MAG TPA: FTR1 family protein, partial [Dermatophilaceae bacterium]|nr:FTR1 family protein [Dermatophilaceae bacterium]